MHIQLQHASFLTQSPKSHITWLFSLLKMATLVYICVFSGDFKCKYRLHFSFKNHVFANPLLTPPKPGNMPSFLESMLTYSSNVLGRRL
jgi:hypothetical protein